ncbi:hypothetical protein DSM104299_00274 [Baekduia alba]|uniref:hypothetical protein n=1 Tax=Baekduia alba TaxID=2997333 RepID=UPI0023418060|nr:hypothetical protein [Baekduia alba]WCB91601.1 hypothetical protein DSM104299_00274 [Baekduia alba]
MTFSATIALQHATSEHDGALRELAQLDSARTVSRPALMAVVDGRLVAAIDLHSERVVADPFADTEDAVKLLRLRAAELRGHGTRRRARRRLPSLGLRPRVAV